MAKNLKAAQNNPRAKLTELILYIAARNALNPKFGATKLNKILFYSDLEAYFEYGNSITGEEYFKLQYGTAPRRMKPVLTELEESGELSIYYVQWATGKQRRFAPKREHNLDIFSANEIAIVDRVIQWLWDEDANEVSDRSHKFVAWKKVREFDTIPFNTAAFVCNPDDIVITEEAIRRAKRFVEPR